MSNKLLPPMPSSDTNSLQRNSYDGFYKVQAREFWGENEISHNELKPDMKCDHDFIRKGPEVICTKCHFGLIGSLEISNGKLFHEGTQIGI